MEMQCSYMNCKLIIDVKITIHIRTYNSKHFGFNICNFMLKFQFWRGWGGKCSALFLIIVVDIPFQTIYIKFKNDYEKKYNTKYLF